MFSLIYNQSKVNTILILQYPKAAGSIIEKTVSSLLNSISIDWECFQSTYIKSLVQHMQFSTTCVMYVNSTRGQCIKVSGLTAPLPWWLPRFIEINRSLGVDIQKILFFVCLIVPSPGSVIIQFQDTSIFTPPRAIHPTG